MAEQKTTDNGAYQMITPPNRLKAKVGPGKGVDPKVLERAQSMVDGMAGDFEARAINEVARIVSRADLIEQGDNDDRVVEIFRIGHELKGQGGTFGYPLVSKIGNSLCRYVEALSEQQRIDLAVVRAHASALHAILSKKITGDGGDLEQQLLEELDRLVQKSLG